jgi:hypothetical protein
MRDIQYVQRESKKNTGHVVIVFLYVDSLLDVVYRDGIFKRLRSPGIDYKESILPTYVAWRAGTTTLFLLRSWPPWIVIKYQHR